MDHSARAGIHPHHRRASSMCWCRSRSIRPIPTGCRAAWSSSPATWCACRSAPREVIAVVWAENANPDPRLHNRLKDVGEKLDVPPLKGELRALVDWVANYTLSARGMVLRMTLRKNWARISARSGCGWACA